jgi:hypothetical protein
MRKFLGLVLCTLSSAAFFLSPPVATRINSAATPDSPSDVNINFSVMPVTNAAWYGQVSGGVTGNLTLDTLERPPRAFRSAWVGRTQWKVVAGANTFVALLNGKINTLNGTTIMRGIVVDGAYLGAEVEVRGQVAAFDPSQFVGTIRIIQP